MDTAPCHSVDVYRGHCNQVMKVSPLSLTTVTLALLAILLVGYFFERIRSRKALDKLNSAYEAITRNDMRILLNGIELYRLDCGTYILQTNGLKALFKDDLTGWKGPYVIEPKYSNYSDRITDAWGHEIQYEIHQGLPQLRSSGRDGLLSTADDIILP
jgi:hypothetical protein